MQGYVRILWIDHIQVVTVEPSEGFILLIAVSGYIFSIEALSVEREKSMVCLYTYECALSLIGEIDDRGELTVIWKSCTEYYVAVPVF